jgi:hypothetical protein
MIFRKHKPTWREIKPILVRLLEKTNTIQTFGTIGSCNPNKDIDIIITKKPYSSSAQFYKELHRIFEDLDRILKKIYGIGATRFSRSYEETVIKSLSKENKTNILFHTMVYHSYSQMKKDWAWALLPEDNIKKIIEGNYKILKGNIKDLYKKEFQKENYYDSIFTFLYLYDKINSHYPKKVLISSLQESLIYLFSKRLNLEAPLIKDKEDAKRAIYLLCSIVDKLNLTISQKNIK